MAIDILNIQPTVISKDLKGKFLLLYSQPKAGKTSFAAQLPKNLLCAFEVGYHAISGIHAVDIDKWMTFKQIVKQLEKPEARAMYDTVTIDTFSIARDLCEQYVCQQNGVNTIGDIAWGQGYGMVKKELETTLRKITMMGYGLVLICHSKARKEVKADGTEVEILGPNLDSRAYEVANALVDLIGYIGIEFQSDGSTKRYLYTRQTPTVFAGSRWKYLDAKIPFGYNELVDAIGRAIDKEVETDGAVVGDVDYRMTKQESRPYEEVRAEALKLWTELVDKDPENATKILKKAEMLFGHKLKLSEITEDQVDLFSELVSQMKTL